jgi:hypothetical protein
MEENKLMRWILSFLCLGLLACGSPEPPEPTPDVGAEENKPPPRWLLAATQTPRGLLKNEPGAAPGYVLFTQFASDLTYLMNLEGQVVHTWKHEKVGDALYLQDDGSLFRLARMPDPPNFKAGGVSGYLQKLSWDSEVLWEWKMGDEKRMLHHDIEPLPNGNVLAIAWELKTAEEAVAAGRRADLVPEQGLWSEWILEVQPVPPNDAKIVWEWRVWDHLVPPDGKPFDHPRKLDINADAEAPEVDAAELEQLKALGYVPDDATEEDIQSDFLHMNAVDYHAGLDQIAVSVPEIGEVWILDHSTSTEEARGERGDFLYRWGNPRVYGRGEKADQKLFYQHQALWIPEGMANAGNLTVFNNGGERGWSSVMEWTPPLQADGSYPLPESGPFGPEQTVWEYAANDRESFYAPFVSGAHRLPNGNTFICEGPQGHYFEVTPAGEIVWEYRNPYHGDVKAWMPEGTEQFLYASFRAMKIPPDHPGLAGRELRPLDPQPPVHVP